MPVTYNSQAIIPAPFVRVEKEYQTTDDGTPVGSLFLITLSGHVIPHKGSPNSSGVFWNQSGYPPDEVLTSDQQLGAIMVKMQALRTLFATPGQTFEVVGIDGVKTMQCNPRIRGNGIGDGFWFNEASYSVTLECDTLLINGVEDTGDIQNYKVSKANEEWNVEILDVNLGTYRLTHSLSAVGKRFYDNTGALVKAAWQNAQDYVLNKIGLGLKPARMAADGVLNADTVQAFNYLRGQSISELGGVFSVTETWVCFDPAGGPAAYEEFEINTRTGMDGRSQVSVAGNITGLAKYDNTTRALITGKYANATAKWALIQPSLFSRAQTVSGVTLNPVALNTTRGDNEIAGTIQYGYEYDNRPNADSVITGAKSVVIAVDIDNPADVFAKIPIPGRAIGPILQAMSTVTEKRMVISVEALMGAATYTSSPAQPDTDSLMLSFAPAVQTFFVESDRENFVANTGRYARNTTFTWV